MGSGSTIAVLNEDASPVAGTGWADTGDQNVKLQ